MNVAATTRLFQPRLIVVAWVLTSLLSLVLLRAPHAGAAIYYLLLRPTRDHRRAPCIRWASAAVCVGRTTPSVLVVSSAPEGVTGFHRGFQLWRIRDAGKHGANNPLVHSMEDVDTAVRYRDETLDLQLPALHLVERPGRLDDVVTSGASWLCGPVLRPPTLTRFGGFGRGRWRSGRRRPTMGPATRRCGGSDARAAARIDN